MPRRARLPITLTHDFDLMPPLARAQVLFISSTRLTLKGFLTGGPLVWKLMRRLRRTPGFVYQKGTYRFPLTTGSITFFDSYEALETFARSPEHRALVRWSSVPGRIGSGFIRIMRTAPTGSAFGSWVPAVQLDQLDRRRLIPIVTRETDWPATGEPVASPPVPAQHRPDGPVPAVAPVVTGCPVAHGPAEEPTTGAVTVGEVPV